MNAYSYNTADSATVKQESADPRPAPTVRKRWPHNLSDEQFAASIAALDDLHVDAFVKRLHTLALQIAAESDGAQ